MSNLSLGKTITLTDAEFNEISKIVYDNYGINLTEKKRSLVTGRLQNVLKTKGFNTFAEYINFIKENGDEALSELVNKISTNHTFFYREYAHFEFLTNVALPQFEEYRNKTGCNRIKIWCAAASSGEEPYTIAIHLLEYFGVSYSKWKAGLLATDISEDALSKAILGEYSSEGLEKVPQNIVSKYFNKTKKGYVVKDILKKEVLYRKFNLMTPTFPFKKDFDLISCRNVMIYFDRETKEKLVNKLYDQLRPGGYLFIGHSETLNGLNTPFKYVKSAIYQK